MTQHQSTNENDLSDRAQRAYFRGSPGAAQPSMTEVFRIGNRLYAVLSNVRGALAVYSAPTDGGYKRISRVRIDRAPAQLALNT